MQVAFSLPEAIQPQHFQVMNNNRRGRAPANGQGFPENIDKGVFT